MQAVPRRPKEIRSDAYGENPIHETAVGVGNNDNYIYSLLDFCWQSVFILVHVH